MDEHDIELGRIIQLHTMSISHCLIEYQHQMRATSVIGLSSLNVSAPSIFFETWIVAGVFTTFLKEKLNFGGDAILKRT